MRKRAKLPEELRADKLDRVIELLVEARKVGHQVWNEIPESALEHRRSTISDALNLLHVADRMLYKLVKDERALAEKRSEMMDVDELYEMNREEDLREAYVRGEPV